MEKNLKTVGQALRQRRSELQIDQKTAASLLGVTQATFSRWEADQNEPKARESLEALAKFLKLSLQEVAALIGGTAMRRVMREIREWDD